MEPNPEPNPFKEREIRMDESAADNLSEEAGLTTSRMIPSHTDRYNAKTFQEKYTTRFGIGNTREVHTLGSNKVNFKELGKGNRLNKNHMTRKKISRILDNAQLTVDESDDPAESLILVGKALKLIGIKIKQPVTEEDADEHRDGGRRTRRNRKSRKKFKRNHRKSRR